VLKRCQVEITSYYIDEKSKFQHDAFWDFKALVGMWHDAIPMRWVYDALNLNSDAQEYLHITPTGHSIRYAHRDLVIGETKPITHELFLNIIDSTMQQSTGECILQLLFKLSFSFDALYC
jgi:hypothetical protein